MQKQNKQVSILFVCMGNICRSPAGEGVFQHYVQQAGHEDNIRIDSAGTIGYHTGGPADARMQAAAKKRGYSLNSIARQVRASDIEDFDLIVAMDVENLENIDHIAGGRMPHIRMLGSFLEDSDDLVMGRSVPDPYYGGDAGFEEVLNMIESACPAMLKHCLSLLDNK
ncbi:MAG: protein-tyrosine phosphatase [Gammaproteobacteria bacterium]|jgi:protein-tyrosine phosphatase